MDAKQALLALAINLAEMTVQRDDERAQVEALRQRVAELEKQVEELTDWPVGDTTSDIVDND